MNLIIAGGRDFDNWHLLWESLERILKDTDKSTITVFCGMAKGADTLGKQYALLNNIPVKLFPADWDTHGKKAGILRNQEMIDAGATHLVAFWDQKSRGTADMIKRATKAGLAVRVVKYEPKEEK
jgi:hypothetical protein